MAGECDGDKPSASRISKGRSSEAVTTSTPFLLLRFLPLVNDDDNLLRFVFGQYAGSLGIWFGYHIDGDANFVLRLLCEFLYDLWITVLGERRVLTSKMNLWLWGRPPSRLHV